MSFVSEKQTFRIQNMHWGFETSNVYMAEKSRDRNSTLDHSIFQLHHLAKDRKQRDCFDWHFCPPCFRGLMSEHCGPSPHPKHVVWKGLDDLEMVLYFGLVFCLSFSPRKSCEYQVRLRLRMQISPFRKAQWGCFPLCVSVKGRVTVPVGFQGLCFSPVP